MADPMDPNRTNPDGELEDWDPGGFARDSMIHALGALAQRVLGFAYAERPLRRALALTPNHGAKPRPLYEASLGDGTVSLYARTDTDEFVVGCRHKEFRALISTGFELARGRFLGVCVSSFEGDPGTAAVWARAFTERLPGTQPRSGAEGKLIH